MNIDQVENADRYLLNFKLDVCEGAASIDPTRELDWFSLSIGYFLAEGVPIEEAEVLAEETRYTHGYWQS